MISLDTDPPLAPSNDIRIATMGDLDAMVDLDARCFEPGVAYDRKLILNFLSQQDIVAPLIEEEGKLIAFALGSIGRNGRGHLITIDVDHVHRRKKLGQRLLDFILERMTAKGTRRVMLEVSENNHVAETFYLKNGFARTGFRPEYYGPGKSAILMEKPLGGYKSNP